MLSLPALARGGLLVNFCNLGPILHRNSVVMIHDAQTFLYPEDYTGRQAAAYRGLLPVIARSARRVLTVSGFSRESLAEHRICRAEKIGVIHNGTDHILDTAPDPAILEKHGLAGKPFVLVLGSAKGYKNIRRVFDAMRNAGLGLPLVVAGGAGEEAYRSKGWEPPEGTIFTGFVSDGELRALYEAATVFGFPSQTEGFGLPPVEAMQCGTPVIAARAGAMPEVCADGAILVDPEDTDAWRAALQQLTTDPEQNAQWSARARERAAKLSWAAAGDQLWKQISALL
ncbi:glycosyltransferase family 4 protein [Alloyangia pacifica]|uniref:glycosyltransferase family 4 protein n=1 Tax=Alloyangia pacifica TaxID=311180 RepID=UPI001CD3B284|nr:glycosyltransferase family 1 protein [Alloyangia pacifica]MCA0994791.1 glycosyltransferase family 4 protein [Alloyangia pacifica]